MTQKLYLNLAVEPAKLSALLDAIEQAVKSIGNIKTTCDLRPEGIVRTIYSPSPYTQPAKPADQIKDNLITIEDYFDAQHYLLEKTFGGNK